MSEFPEPKHYPHKDQPRQLWQVIANEIVMAKYHNEKLLSVGQLVKKLGKTKEDILGAINGVWADLMIYKGNVICKTWLKYPDQIHFIK